MKVNRKSFFEALRSTIFHGGYSQSQVNGLERLLTVFEKYYAAVWEQEHGRAMTLQMAAYCLATSYWETAHRMMPVYETLARNPGQAKARLEAWYQKKHPSVRPYWREGWFGRGDVQLTHKDNYAKATKMLGRMGIFVDLVIDPELAMDSNTSAHILFAGSYKGLFSGKALPDFIDADDENDFSDYVHARAVINGKDKAQAIAAIATHFESALVASILEEQPFPAASEPYEPPETEDHTPQKSTTIMAAAGQAAAAITGLFSALGDMNPWIAGLLIVVSVVALVWIIREQRRKARLGV